jgi:hypothetical protein
MSRTLRVVILASVASVLGACSQSPTAPAAPTQPNVSNPKQLPSKANADGVCDWINPWARC